MSNLFDVLAAVAESDAKQQAEKAAAENAARNALNAQRFAPGEMDLNQLLGVLDGDEAPAPKPLNVPKPQEQSSTQAPEPTDGKPRVARFPPPPTGGVPHT